MWLQGLKGVEDPLGTEAAHAASMVRWLSSAGLSPLYFARCADLWINAPTSPGERISPRLCGAHKACQRRNDRGKPVRALPARWEQPMGNACAFNTRDRCDPRGTRKGWRDPLPVREVGARR